MQISKIVFAGAVIGVLTGSSAEAATSNLVNKGTAVDLSLGSSLPTTVADCSIDVSISLTAATSVQHVGSTTAAGAGAQLYVVINDLCMGTQEFGFLDAPLASTAFTTTSKSAKLTASFALTMAVFDPSFNQVGTRNRTLTASALTFDAVGTDTFSSKNHIHYRFPGFKSVSNGHSIEKPANVTGTLSLDGQLLFPNPTSAYTAGFNTSHDVSVTITK